MRIITLSLVNKAKTRRTPTSFLLPPSSLKAWAKDALKRWDLPNFSLQKQSRDKAHRERRPGCGRGGGGEKIHYEQLQGTCRSNLRCQAAVVEVEQYQDEALCSFTRPTRANWHILHHQSPHLIYSHRDASCNLQML